MKFSMSQLMNDQSKEAGSKERMAFKVEFISIERLHPSKMNKYSVQDVAELKSSIELMGLQQNLLVRAKDGNYEVISGHRRLKAMEELYADGNEQFKRIPCKIMRTTDDVQAELQLLLANSTTRELSDYEKTYQAERLQELLQELKDSGHKFTGRRREIVADLMGVSSSQVARMDSINKNLSPELKEEFSEGGINITTAYELSRLPEEVQKEVLEEQPEGQPLTPGIAKEKRAEMENKPTEERTIESVPVPVADPAEIFFRKQFKRMVSSFGVGLEALNGISDSETKVKCSEEIFGLIEKMEAALPNPQEIIDEEFEKNQVTIYDELK